MCWLLSGEAVWVSRDLGCKLALAALVVGEFEEVFTDLFPDNSGELPPSPEAGLLPLVVLHLALALEALVLVFGSCRPWGLGHEVLVPLVDLELEVVLVMLWL